MGVSRIPVFWPKILWPSFTPQFLKLSAANILSNLMVPFASLVDTAFLGHLSEIHYLGGVALATILFNYLYWSFGFLRMGTTGLTAQAVGREESGEIWLLLGRSGLMAVAIAAVILLLQWPIRELGFSLLNATATIQASGIAFYQGRIWGAPAVLLNFVLLGWFLGQGQGRRVLVLAAIANGGNILLDYAFVINFGWASFGAGLATALSQYLALIMGLGFVLQQWRARRPAQVHIQGSAQGSAQSHVPETKFTPKLWHWPALKALFALNRDILIRTFALVTAFSLFTNLSSGFGETVLAANTLLLQVISLAAYFIDGFAFSTETFAGNFAVDPTPQRQKQLLGLGLGLSLICGLGFSLLFYSMPGLFQLLTHHQSVLDRVAQSRLWLFPVLGVGSIAYLLDGYFLGLTAGPVLRNASLMSTGLFFMPLAIAAVTHHNPTMLWFALSSLMVGRALTLGTVLIFRRYT